MTQRSRTKEAAVSRAIAFDKILLKNTKSRNRASKTLIKKHKEFIQKSHVLSMRKQTSNGKIERMNCSTLETLESNNESTLAIQKSVSFKTKLTSPKMWVARKKLCVLLNSV